ncbi:hypothetical protein C8R45DRAFT_964862 [Mycena sanguinolenta]|nr:hypothetical protein C8R45DRAFT_964862 [Mycena sanguinolenta]
MKLWLIYSLLWRISLICSPICMPLRFAFITSPISPIRLGRRFFARCRLAASNSVFSESSGHFQETSSLTFDSWLWMELRYILVLHSPIWLSFN